VNAATRGEASELYVFGYGSLVALPGARPARLRGWRRVWSVAMDNRVVEPGYKVYESPEGERPAVCVAFLDLVEDPASLLDGTLLAVDARTLAELDARERQYERIDVTEAITFTNLTPHAPGSAPTPSLAPRAPGSAPKPSLAPGARVFTYVGSSAGRARVRDGREVVIQRAYAEAVERAFAALGPGFLERYRATTEPPPFPLAELARVDT
jgi:hypothetical protein